MKWDGIYEIFGTVSGFYKVPHKRSRLSLFVFIPTCLSRKCSCTAGSWCVAGWRSAPAVPRAATGECGERQEGRTQLVCRARCWRAAQSASTGRTRTPNAQAGLLAALLWLLRVTSEAISQHARSLPFFKHHAVGLDRLAGLTPSDLAQRSGEVSSLLTNLTLLGLHPPKVKSYAVQKAAHPFPPFLFYNKSPFIQCSKIRSWVWYFRLRTLKIK